jgi:FkbM family methyltransferase
MSKFQALQQRAKRTVVGRFPETSSWLRSRWGTRANPETGFFTQAVYGHSVFLKRPEDYLDVHELEWLCRDVYFRLYEPCSTDVVVDIGAGYGHEAFYLLTRSPGVRYFGVEVQPSVYECLCNSFRTLASQFRAIGTAVSDTHDRLQISSAADYVRASTAEDGYVEVPATSWPSLLERYDIGRIDLLKVNIEGGERALLPALGDMKDVARVIISAHDFRAERGEGEHFRTREFVHEYLEGRGFRVQRLAQGGWLGDWLFAERSDARAA